MKTVNERGPADQPPVVDMRAMEAIAGPLDRVMEMVDSRMGAAKDRDECTADEIAMRFVWHGLHYVQRRLTGHDDLPEDLTEDWKSWQKTALQFEAMMREREATP